MRNFTISLLFVIQGIISYGQNGLERILVEKYYISDANDAMKDEDGGTLPIGSVTYRVYADMLPGYIFQAAYGIPNHELKFQTSTKFFNNEDRGNTSPKISKTNISKNTVMLDSWLSVGAGCLDHFGVLKSNDNGIGTVTNKDNILMNSDPLAGIPLTEQDGLVEGTDFFPEDVTFVSLSNVVNIFNSSNSTQNGDKFSTFNGAWASLNGSMGYDTLDNIVLIAQITTDGEFEFELNIQIRSRDAVVEKYVARDVENGFYTIPSLIYPDTTVSAVKFDDNKKSTFTVFPNPTNNELLLVLGSSPVKDIKFLIFDFKGTIVKSGKIDNNNTENRSINVSDLANGVYIVEVVIDGNVYKHSKFVKSN